MSLHLVVGHCTDQGHFRKNNEDSYCVLVPPKIASDLDAFIAVADGMGGHQGGEVASQFISDTLKYLFTSQEYRRWVDYPPEHEDYYILVLKEIMERMNEQLYRKASRRKDLRGMGTTATIALIAGAKLYVGHVGDSRAYLITDDSLRQLTKDHSWVMEQVDKGKMTLDEAASHPEKNRVTRAIGADNVVRVDRFSQEISIGDTLVLCTDGLTNMVNDSELCSVVRSSPDPQQTAQALVDLAKRYADERGGGDNITVVVARVVSEKQVQPVALPSLTTAEIEQITRMDTQPLQPPETTMPLQPKSQLRFVQGSLLSSILVGLAMIVLLSVLSFVNAEIALALSNGASAPASFEQWSVVSVAGGRIFYFGVLLSTFLVLAVALAIYTALLWWRSNRSHGNQTESAIPSGGQQ